MSANHAASFYKCSRSSLSACHQGWALTLDPDTTDRSRADFVRYRRFTFQAVNGIRCHDYLDNVVLGARLACMTMDKPPTPPV